LLEEYPLQLLYILTVQGSRAYSAAFFLLFHVSVFKIARGPFPEIDFRPETVNFKTCDNYFSVPKQ
jgi:hypothetical protein